MLNIVTGLCVVEACHLIPGKPNSYLLHLAHFPSASKQDLCGAIMFYNKGPYTAQELTWNTERQVVVRASVCSFFSIIWVTS